MAKLNEHKYVELYPELFIDCESGAVFLFDIEQNQLYFNSGSAKSVINRLQCMGDVDQYWQSIDFMMSLEIPIKEN